MDNDHLEDKHNHKNKVQQIDLTKIRNIDGIIQQFSPALHPVGESQPEWQVMIDVAKDLKINSQFYSKFSSPEMILKEMGKEIPFFKKKDD